MSKSTIELDALDTIESALEITRFLINAGEAAGDVVSFIWACDKNNNSRHLLSSNEQAELMSYSEKSIEFAVNFLNKQNEGKGNGQ